MTFQARITLDGVVYTSPGAMPPSYFVNIREDGRADFHLGALGDLKAGASPAPYHLGPHQVEILDGGGAVIQTYNLAAHWWNAEWTHRSTPLAIVKEPSQLVAANRMFPYGDTGCKVTAPRNDTYAGPMDPSGVTQYMPTTGERPDIGLVTDPAAWWMLGGAPGPMLAWCQANNSCPDHYRDENTGRPVDLTKYPQANAFDVPGKQGAPWLDKGPPTPSSNGYHQYGGGWTPQQAHFCDMAYAAVMATQDDDVLEDLQYDANFVVLADATKSTPASAVISGELRGLAWGIGLLFKAHIATADRETRGPLPSSLQPSSYFKILLDNALAEYRNVMDDPAQGTFHVFAGGDRFGPWQVDYILTALAFGVLTGHSEWIPLYLWALKNAIDRTSGKSGYPPGYGGAYYMNRFPWKLDASGNPISGALDTSGVPFTWAQSAKYCMAVDPDGSPLTADQQQTLVEDPLNKGVAMVGREYLMTTRTVIVTAQYIHAKGLADVKAAYPDLDLCFANVDRMVRAGGDINARQSVVLDASAPPPVLSPLPDPSPIPPPPTTPPAKDIHMGKPFTIAVGQTIHLPLTFDDGAGGAAQAPTNIVYKAEPADEVELTPDEAGVTVKGLKGGSVVITVDAAGDGPLEDTDQGTVTLPLAKAIHLNV